MKPAKSVKNISSSQEHIRFTTTFNEKTTFYKQTISYFNEQTMMG